MTSRVTTRTLMVCAAVGVAAGLVLVPVNYAPVALQVTAPLLVLPLTGFWCLPPLLGLGLLRRPGAGVLTSTIAGLVTVPLTPFGWMGLAIGVVFGAVAELAFLVTRYRIWRWWLFAVSGAVVGGLAAIPTVFTYGLDQMGLAAQIFGIVSQPVSGALCALLAAFLADRLARAGVAGSARSAARVGG